MLSNNSIYIKLPFGVHYRVLRALALREIYTLYGHTRLGYIWNLFQSVFGIMTFWIIRVFMNGVAPHGMTIVSYLVCGFLVWNITTQILTKSMHAIDGNRNLLTFPQVFPLDVMLARAVVVVATQVVSMGIILGIGAMFGYAVTISDVGLLLAALLLAVSFGLGCGAMLSALAAYVPALHNIVPMVLRILFFASGVFFSVSMFSHRVGEWLLLNPIMQLVEMTRTAMSQGYVSPYFDVEYLLFVNLSVLGTGLLLERFIRRRLQA